MSIFGGAGKGEEDFAAIGEAEGERGREKIRAMNSLAPHATRVTIGQMLALERKKMNQS